MTGTKVVTRSSPTEGLAMADCVATIDQLSKKRSRNPSKPTGTDKVSTSAGAQSTPIAEDAPQRQPGSSDDGEINLIAANLWNQLFKSTDYVRLAGNREFFHKRVLKLLSRKAALRITEGIGRDVMNRKVDFIRSKETDTAKLKLSLQEQFTKLVIKQVVIELAQSKAEVTARLEYIAGLDDQVLKKQAVLQEKTFEKNKQVTEAESRVNDLVGVVNEHLAEIREEDPEVGSLRHTLGLLEEFLGQSVITLPKVIDGVRANADSEKSIYKKEYEQLPQAVKECFDDSVALINLANEAAAAERVAVAEYKLIHDKINEDNGEQITDLREKITLIEEAEAIAGKIVEAQTF